MTEITREIIMDLLPTYFSGEASEDTRRLVEGYFEHDPEFAKMARRLNEKLLESVPVYLSENHEMSTLRRAQSEVQWRVIGLVVVVSSIVVITLIVMVYLAIAR